MTPDGELNPPVLPAYSEPFVGSPYQFTPVHAMHGSLRVWCEHEQRWHIHGEGDGHRVAECTCPRSPYRYKNGGCGYVLKTVGEWTDEIRRSRRVARRGYGCPTCRKQGITS